MHVYRVRVYKREGMKPLSYPTPSKEQGLGFLRHRLESYTRLSRVCTKALLSMAYRASDKTNAFHHNFAYLISKVLKAYFQKY